MTTKKLLSATILIVAVMGAPKVMFAQTAETGALGGTVTDATGAVVSGASVRVINAATGQVRTATSQANGRYGEMILHHMCQGAGALLVSGMSLVDQSGTPRQSGGEGTGSFRFVIPYDVVAEFNSWLNHQADDTLPSRSQFEFTERSPDCIPMRECSTVSQAGNDGLALPSLTVPRRRQERPGGAADCIPPGRG